MCPPCHPLGGLTRYQPLILRERELAGGRNVLDPTASAWGSRVPPACLALFLAGFFSNTRHTRSAKRLRPVPRILCCTVCSKSDVLAFDSVGVRFELVSESSKAYPSSASGDIVGLLGSFARPFFFLSSTRRAKAESLRKAARNHHEDRLPPVRAASGRCRQQPQPRGGFGAWTFLRETPTNRRYRIRSSPRPIRKISRDWTCLSCQSWHSLVCASPWLVFCLHPELTRSVQ